MWEARLVEGCVYIYTPISMGDSDYVAHIYYILNMGYRVRVYAVNSESYDGSIEYPAETFELAVHKCKVSLMNLGYNKDNILDLEIPEIIL